MYMVDKIVNECSPFQLVRSRSSRPEMFCRKGFLRNFAKFTGKHLCLSLFLNKVSGLRPVTLLKKRLWPVTLLKKRLWHMCFPVIFKKCLRTPFFMTHLRWLLSKITFQCLNLQYQEHQDIFFNRCTMGLTLV